MSTVEAPATPRNPRRVAHARAARALLFVAALVVAVPASLASQITAGTVTGTVIDALGGRVPGAAVVFTSETQGTKTRPAMTDPDGVYIVAGLAPDRYTIAVSLSGFRTTTKSGVRVSDGDRVVLDPLVLEVGGATEVVTVQADASVLDTASSERSSVIDAAALENLPIFSHDFLQFAAVQPGVNEAALGTGAQEGRIGGGGQDNVLIDGVSVMDTGNNGVMGGLNLPVQAVSEVKVLTSGYAPEYGRSSGLQIAAVTKSGSNRFHVSMYDYQRDSGLNANSWANSQNGTAKAVSSQGDFGFVFGGPIGKPGGDNRLFFSYTQEFRPRTAGNVVERFRVPTLLERSGDFSQTLDDNGALFDQIYDASTGLPKSDCSAAIQTACFQDGGVFGRIPAARLYGPGLAILNQYPVPNIAQTPGQSYNYTITSPVQRQLGYTPGIRIDYQALPTLRLSGKWAGANARVVPAIGSLPGFNDTLQKFPLSLATSFTVNDALTRSTFLEVTYGLNQNQLGAPPIDASANRNTVNCPAALAATVPNCALGSIAFLFPAAGTVDPRYYEYGALQQVGTPAFENGQLLLPPQIAWSVAGTSSHLAGAPPSINYPAFMNINRVQQVNASVTKVSGTHTLKVGVLFEHSYKAQNANSAVNAQGAIDVGPDANNPIDAGFPYANAALGIFSSDAQQSRFVEGHFLYDSLESYAQDTWKANRSLTLDYGVRVVHDQPQYDQFEQVSNFFPNLWTVAGAPALYLPGCVGAAPCAADAREAVDPRTGALVGPGTASLIGQAVPGTGNPENGIVQAGQGIAKTGYLWPGLGIAPRAGAAYDVGGRHTFVVRGSAGLYFDRPDGNSVFNTAANPPVATGLTEQWGLLASLPQFPAGPVPTLHVYEYDSKLPSDVQWSGGIQTTLPWSSALDVAYVGHHAFNLLGGQQGANAVDLNTIDLGTTLAASAQDPTGASGTVLPNNLLRPYRGYSNVLVQWGQFHRTYHSLQTSWTRRFRGGFSAGASWTWSLSDRGNTGLPSPQLRLDHNADGTFTVRADQAVAESLFANQGTTSHIVTANFTWAPAGPKGLGAISTLLSHWQISGVFRANSGAPYDVGYTYDTGGGTMLTGSPDFTGRIVVTGNPGSGCSSNQYVQFNTAAFSGPLPGSVGLESGRGLLHNCALRQIDLAIARDVTVWHHTQLRLRLDIYNALNALVFTSRVTTVELASPATQTVMNPEVLSNGTVDPTRVLPEDAGFGAATGAAPLRSMQIQVQLKF